MISVCVPTHDIPERKFFLARLERSLEKQTYRDFELVVTSEGKMAENTNAAIKKAKGGIIKLLYMDDYLYSHEALEHIADRFQGGWLASGCVHDDAGRIANPHVPRWGSLEDMARGNNTIGSPSVVAFENDNPLLFDHNLSFFLDCEFYYRLYQRYGVPTIVPELDIAIGLGPHQTTNVMSDDEKMDELRYLAGMYEGGTKC